MKEFMFYFISSEMIQVFIHLHMTHLYYANVSDSPLAI